MQVNLITSTSGTGFWTPIKATIEIQELDVDVYGEDSDGDVGFAELRAYFAPEQWNCDKHGFIYSDPQWIKTFREALVSVLGFTKEDVAEGSLNYTEQGMQGAAYVSLEVDGDFMREWNQLSNVADPIA